MENKTYDIIVIGSGIGGLSAAAILAHEGYSVLVLEKNNRIGGACSSYTKQGFLIDDGVHIFAEAAGMKGRFGDVLNKIGLATKNEFKAYESPYLKFVEDINQHSGMKVKGEPGYRPMAFGISPPKSTSAKRDSNDHDKSMKVGIQKIPKGVMKVAGEIIGMRKKKLRQIYNDKMDLESFIKKYTDDKRTLHLFAFMSGVFFTIPPRLTSAGEFIYVLRKAVASQASSYPIGGAIAIPKAFAKGVELNGGKVITSKTVKKITVKDQKASGVELEDGTELKAKLVISNADIRNTVNELVGRTEFDKEYLNKIDNLVSSYAVIGYKFALEEPVIPDKMVVNLFYEKMENFDSNKYDIDPKDAPLRRVGFFGPIPSNIDPNLAPSGKQLAFFGCSVPRKVHNWPKLKKVYLQDIYEFLPKLEDKQIFVDITTPMIIESWIGKKGGPVEGTALTPDQSGPFRISSELPIGDLYNVGDTCGTDTHGIGTQIAADSGIKCAEYILARFS